MRDSLDSEFSNSRFAKNGRKKGKVLLLLEIPLILVIICQAWYKPFPLWVYLLASALLGVLIGYSIIKGRQHQGFIILQLFLLAILVRSIYYLATHYSVLPFGDAYGQYQVAAAYSQYDKALIISGGGPSSYAGWPGLHLLAIALSRICNVDLLHIAIALPWIFVVGWFLFSYLLLKRIEQDLHLREEVTNFALLALATISCVYIPPMFTQLDIGIFLLTVTFYLAYKQFSQPSPANSFLLLIIIAALVVTHHYTSFVAVVYLASLSSLALGGKYLATKKQPGFLRGAKSSTSLSIVGVIGAIFLALWWTSYSTLLLSPGTELLPGSVTAAIFPSALQQAIVGVDVWPANYSASLMSGWALIVLALRNIAIYIPALIGFALLCLKRSEKPQWFFLIYSLIVAGAMFFVECFVTHVASYRPVPLFMPFAVLCVGMFYDELRNKWRHHSSTIFLIAMAALLVFSSLVGLWANRYIPAHLYDPKVSWVEAGEHPVDWQRLKGFFDEHVAYEDVNQFLADDHFILTLILPSEQWDKIQYIGLRNASLSSNTMVVALMGLSTKSYMMVQGQTTYAAYDPDFNEVEFKQEVNEKCNLIYNDGKFRLWRGKGK